MQGGFGKVYNEMGVDNYYTKSGQNYTNPHKYDIQRLIRKKLAPGNKFINIDNKILDLACGSGQATLPLKHLGYKNIVGCDPYTFQKYQQMTGLTCMRHSFIDILQGNLDQERYDIIVVSYALHLVRQSMLYSFCNKLALISKKLIIISPHKFPVMNQNYGWKQVQNSVLDRIHLRIYQSYQYQQLTEQTILTQNN